MCLQMLARTEKILARQRNGGLRNRYARDNQISPATAASLFPQVRWWRGPVYQMWGPSVEYSHTDSKGDRYIVSFSGDEYSTIRCWVTTHKGESAEIRVLCKVDRPPWGLATLRTFAWYKRRLTFLTANQRQRRDVSNAVTQRYWSYSRACNDFALLQDRHEKLYNKVSGLYNKAKEAGTDADITHGWLRLLRHIRKNTGLIAYTNNEVEAIDGVVSWPRYEGYPRKSRSKGKISRVMAAAGISDHITGLMYQEWDALHKHNYDFKEISGDDLENAYIKGLGCGSCMTGTGDLISMYTCNPQNIHMVLLRVDDEIVGRALLWYMDDNPDLEDSRYLDRTYPQSDRIMALYDRYCQENGIVYGYYQKDVPSSAQCTIKPPSNVALAYQDSWSGMTVREDTWIMSNDGQYDTGSTEGGPFFCGEELLRCCNCEDVMTEENGVSVGWDWWCRSCHEDNFFSCERCDTDVLLENEVVVDGMSWCILCRDNYSNTCVRCDAVTADTVHDTEDGEVCTHCFTKYVKCFTCNINTARDNNHEHEGQLHCARCITALTGDTQ